MVMMCSGRSELMRSIMAASVVDLPEPVVPGGEHQAALLLADLREDARQLQLFDGANLRGNDAQNHADVAALLKDVDAEAPEAGDAVGHVQFGGFLEFLLLPVGHHAEGHGKHLFRRDARNVVQRVQQAVDAKIGMVADL